MITLMKPLFAALLVSSALSAAGLGLYLNQPDDLNTSYAPLPGYKSLPRAAQPTPTEPAGAIVPQKKPATHPEPAKSPLWLGNECKKAGRPEEAPQVTTCRTALLRDNAHL